MGGSEDTKRPGRCPLRSRTPSTSPSAVDHHALRHAPPLRRRATVPRIAPTRARSAVTRTYNSKQQVPSLPLDLSVSLVKRRRARDAVTALLPEIQLLDAFTRLKKVQSRPRASQRLAPPISRASLLSRSLGSYDKRQRFSRKVCID